MGTPRVLVLSDDRRVARAMARLLSNRHPEWLVEATTSWILVSGLARRGALDAVVVDAFNESRDAALRALQDLRNHAPTVRRIAVVDDDSKLDREVHACDATVRWQAGVGAIALAVLRSSSAQASSDGWEPVRQRRVRWFRAA